MHLRIVSKRRLALALLVAAISILPTSSAGLSQVQTDDLAAQEDLSGAESKRQKSPPPDVQGGWCGSMNDSRVGPGIISVSIIQKGTRLSGTWTSDLVVGGTLKGKVAGNVVTLTLQQDGNQCRGAVNGTLVESGEITGNYTIFGCHKSDGGTFDISRSDC
jgi:hypothetical protein